MNHAPHEPTADQCKEHAEQVFGGNRAVAFWFPQVGGYVGKAWAFPCGNGGWDEDEEQCIDIELWHDGDFPLRSEDGAQPVCLHICMGSQWVEMGQFLEALR